MPLKRKSSYYSSVSKKRRAAGAVARYRFNQSRRAAARRTRRGYASLGQATNTHRYNRWGTSGKTITFSNPATENANCDIYSFADISGYGEFENMYDRFRLDMVQLRVQLVTNPDASMPNPLAGTYNSVHPKMWYCRDYDDSAVENISALKERAKTKCIVLNPNKIYKINVRPACRQIIYRTDVNEGYEPKWKAWLDMAYPTVPHYGLKYSFDIGGAAPTADYPYKIKIEYRYWFTCKDVR